MQSRPCTPVEFYDPTTNTLLELLKNISEEVGELSPIGTIRTKSSSDKEISPAILSQHIHDIFAGRIPSPLPPNIVQAVENSNFPKINRNEKQKQVNLSCSIEEFSRKTSSPDYKDQKNKSCESKRKKSLSTSHSRSHSKDETHGGINSPPPLIHITRTDSNKSSVSKPKESLMERRKPSLTEPLRLGKFILQ